MKSKVTTKKGDHGVSRTLGGEVLSKSHPTIECTGRLDALRAQLAAFRLRLLDAPLEDRQALADFVFWLIHACFLAGAACNDPRNRKPEYHPDRIGPQHLERLEAEQARLEAGLNLPRAFIATASNPLAAEADVLATTARTFERAVVALKEAVPTFEAKDLLAFANRLSDFLYILARHLDGGVHIPVDYAVLDKERGA